MHPSTDAALQEPHLVEVVDHRGRPLCVLPAEEAHRQLLGHRAALVLVFDAKGKLLLKKRPSDAPLYPDRWDLPATGHLKPGQAREDAARQALTLVIGAVGARLSFQEELTPCDGTGYEAVSVYRHVLPAGSAQFDTRDTMFVNVDELAALAEGFRELLAPALVHLLGAGVLSDRSREPTP